MLQLCITCSHPVPSPFYHGTVYHHPASASANPMVSRKQLTFLFSVFLEVCSKQYHRAAMLEISTLIIFIYIFINLFMIYKYLHKYIYCTYLYSYIYPNLSHGLFEIHRPVRHRLRWNRVASHGLDSRAIFWAEWRRTNRVTGLVESLPRIQVNEKVVFKTITFEHHLSERTFTESLSGEWRWITNDKWWSSMIRNKKNQKKNLPPPRPTSADCALDMVCISMHFYAWILTCFLTKALSLWKL